MTTHWDDDDLDDVGYDGSKLLGGSVEGRCRECGCTDEQGCEGGCVWATPAADLCSRCARNYQ